MMSQMGMGGGMPGIGSMPGLGSSNLMDMLKIVGGGR